MNTGFLTFKSIRSRQYIMVWFSSIPFNKDDLQ